MNPAVNMEAAVLAEAYRAGSASPTQVIDEVFDRIAATRDNPIWIHLLPRDAVMARARELEAHADPARLPLYGIPFAVKDNIDIAGLPTTAGCPAYAYQAIRTATVVQRLLDAGAILVGKTNMDQFATGLVGVRSPYGACHSIFNERYISGGSSSGSAVAVAAGLVSFALGTDTAGSGRVPAAFNNIVGHKPTRGLLSAAGVVPACRSLDCVSIFAQDCDDAEQIFDAAQGFDRLDPYSRRPHEAAAPWLASTPRIGVPPASQLEFFGDHGAAQLFANVAETFAALGCEVVEIDWDPFREAARLLYSGPWVAERLAAIEPFLKDHAADMDPTVAKIISGASRYSAVEAFRAAYRLNELKLEAERRWSEMDVLLLPTTPTIYTIAAVEADPVQLNTNLGYYTNFVNLLDLAAVAVPAGFRTNGLPFGVTLMAPAFTDRAVLRLAHRFQRAAEKPSAEDHAPGCVTVAVVGAHLSGQPLNHQLTSRGARYVRTCHTAPGYRFYALAGTRPQKPGLVRDEGLRGPGIEVELWAMPTEHLGSFVAEIPAPLGIGKLELDDGSLVSGFICEPYAAKQATEITSFGAWRAWLRSRQAS